jgi:hypothetical protein
MRVLAGMNQFGLKYTYAWKQHKESLCIAIFSSNYQKHYLSLIIFYDLPSTKVWNRFCPERRRLPK